MPFGLTSSGFITKRLADSKSEIEAIYRAVFGAGIKTTDDTVFGKLIGIQAERESEIWELLEAVYNAFYPDSASDISLDRVCEITAIVRNAATVSTVTAYLAGTTATAIPAGTLFSVQDSNEQFKSLLTVNLSGSNFAISSITSAASIATANSVGHGRAINSFVFINDAAIDEYNGLVQILSVPTADSFTYAITGSPASPAGGTITADPATAVNCESVNTGTIEALATTLNNIVNNISGLERVSNYIDAIKGNNKETDSELRIRRINTLTGIAAARLEGIRGYLLAVADVSSVSVFENTTLTVDVDNRPPKSIECLVVGGTNQDVLDAVFDRKAAGIESYGDISGTVEDSQGESHTTKFSRPSALNIWLEIDLTIDADFPADGDDLVEQAVLDHAATLEIGEDVIVYPYLLSSFSHVVGITDVVLRIGTSASPTLDNNIVVDSTEIASFDSSRITIAHV